jgi:hypothetical protein
MGGPFQESSAATAVLANSIAVRAGAIESGTYNRWPGRVSLNFPQTMPFVISNRHKIFCNLLFNRLAFKISNTEKISPCGQNDISYGRNDISYALCPL